MDILFNLLVHHFTEFFRKLLEKKITQYVDARKKVLRKKLHEESLRQQEPKEIPKRYLFSCLHHFFSVKVIDVGNTSAEF